MSTHCSASPGTSMPSQKLCEPTSTDAGSSRENFAAAAAWARCPAITAIASPSASKAARSASSDQRQHAASSSARTCARQARRATCREGNHGSGVPGPRWRLGKRVGTNRRACAHSRTGCRRAACARRPSRRTPVNQASRSSPPSVADVKTQAFGAAAICSRSVADVQRRLDQRAWCAETSIQRTVPGSDSSAKRAAVWRGRAARSPRRRARSGASSATAASAAAALVPACCSAASAATNSGSTARSFQRSLIVPRRSRSRARRGEAQFARAVLDGARRVPATAGARAPFCRPTPSRSRAKSAAWRWLPGERRREGHAGLGEPGAPRRTPRLDAGQQFGDAGVAQRHVGEEQVVVDDHQVGEHRLAARLHHAAAELRAVRAQAVLARRGHERDDARALVDRRPRPGRRSP